MLAGCSRNGGQKTSPTGPQKVLMQPNPVEEKDAIRKPAQPPQKRKNRKADFSLSAVEFTKEFIDDKQAADAKYKDKIIELEGIVYAAQRAQNYHGNTMVWLYGSEIDPKERIPRRVDVHCLLTPEQSPKGLLLTQDQKARVKAKFSDSGGGKVSGGVFLVEGELAELGPANLVRVSAEQLAKEYEREGEKAGEKYEGHEIAVAGVVKEARDVGAKDPALVVFDGTGAVTIECPIVPHELSMCRVGKRITVKGHPGVYHEVSKRLRLDGLATILESEK
jgi:hypothetical protein